MIDKRKDSKGRVLPDNFHERKDGTYEYKFTLNGKRKSMYAKSLQELKNKVQKLNIDLAKGVEVYENITLEKWFQSYMLEYKKTELRSTTYDNDLRIWNNHIATDVIVSYKIKDIKPIQIQELINNLSKTLSYSTVKLIKSMLNGCFDCAKTNRILSFNPVSDIKLKRTEPKKEKAIFETIEIQNDFLSFIENHPHYKTYMPLFVTMALTGARVGEILGLTWNDINLKDNTISINKTLHYKNINDGKGTHFFITIPKTKASISDIPLMKEVKKNLLQLKTWQFENGLLNGYEVDGIKGFIFVTKRGIPYTNGNVNRVINDVIDAYNDNEKSLAKKQNREPHTVDHMSAHSFRHNMATRLCETSDDIKGIQGILRHANATITMDTYAKVTQKGKNKAMELLENTLKESM